MGIQKIILNFILGIECFFLSFTKIKKKRITFISLESDVLSSDFLMIYQQLNKKDYDIKLCLIHYQRTLKGQFLYFLNCMKQLYLIQTSQVVLIHDNNYVVSHFKRKGVTVIQVWHACGAIKKFGNVVERTYQVRNYDYVLSTSPYWEKAYSQAFGVDKEAVIPLGMPRTDPLFDELWLQEHSQKLLKKYPQLENKKIILYAPTFRGNIYKGFSAIPFDAKRLLDQLGDDYYLLYKFHPWMDNYQLKGHSHILNMNHENLHELLSLSHYLISDYSSIVFDYMILEKPLLFFIPDLHDYMQELGMFVTLEDLGCPLCQTEDMLVQVIQSHGFDQTSMQHLKTTYFKSQDGQSTSRVVAFIESIMSS